MPAETVRRLSAAALLTLLLVPWTAHPDPQPLFDAHLHYNVAHAETLSPKQAAAALAEAGIVRAVVSTRTDALAEALMQAAPGQILPFLDVYETPAHKETWMHQQGLPERIRARLDAGLASGSWRGIGELHLFADDRHSPVFRELLELAHARGLPVMIHGDPAVIDRAYEIEPEAWILWAHAGSFPYPPLVRDYLDRYPELYVDLSMRSERLNPPGGMPLDWQDLLIEHADRFLIGADTFSIRRWLELDEHVADIRAWLAQLPPDVARRIGHDNAAALFATEAPAD
ncbi:Amidohydrolase 2 [Thioalkalivibrio nitratireducens DSM 14787]|uniref:Amidohydrolase 2 n=1 Tax=Thioalkalivibrio nitratireducens (strain DSM 14787 / UNIQEM 213 / ALEN2) TaxID=1255043 RepID=L0DTN3_THIND|nr:amidohydrolase family protein [Thioalkalivibrio nitratireducens]AGA32959.1 Amidohydrolase 2 [Thioalkalivibrio nitratireducens DSM 14787]